MIRVSIDGLRAALSYNPSDGTLRWRERSDVDTAWNRKFAGKTAGGLDHDGYILVSFKGTRIKAHRAIWAICNGEWPDGEIDHINGNPADNRLDNLRVVTRAQNCQNIAGWRRKTLPIGVQLRCDGNAYIAKIMINRKVMHLGSFSTPELAHAAYLRASRDLRGAFVRHKE